MAQEAGVDLIFAPVPKMIAVYVEHFLQPCPPTGIIAPHVRKTLLEMLEKTSKSSTACGCFPHRDDDSEFLYNTCDPHWARGACGSWPRRLPADPGCRFGSRARYALPMFTTLTAPYLIQRYPAASAITWVGRRWGARQEIASKAQTTNHVDVRTLDGQPVPDDPASPVLIIGNSFVRNFREQLCREMNLAPNTLAGDLQSTAAFRGLLRKPQFLEHVRVIVWISTEDQMTNFTPLPEPILAATK